MRFLVLGVYTSTKEGLSLATTLVGFSVVCRCTTDGSTQSLNVQVRSKWSKYGSVVAHPKTLVEKVLFPF